MAACARCGTKVSWRTGHFGNRLCDDCRRAVQEAHDEAATSYQASLGPLRASVAEAVTHLGQLRSRELPEALNADERTAMDVAAFTTFVDRLIGARPLCEWSDLTISAVAEALGATTNGVWRPEYKQVADELLVAALRGGRAKPKATSDEFVLNAGESIYLRVPATRVWTVVEKELKLDETAIELDPNGKVALKKGQISGHEVSHRRTATRKGAFFVTNQRIVFASADPLLWATFSVMSRVSTANQGEVLFDIVGWDERLRVRVPDQQLVQTYIEVLSAMARGTWQRPAPDPPPDTPPVDDETESILERAGKAGLGQATIRQARLYQHIGALNHGWLREVAAAVPEVAAPNLEGTQHTETPGLRESAGQNALVSPAHDRPGEQADGVGPEAVPAPQLPERTDAHGDDAAAAAPATTETEPGTEPDENAGSDAVPFGAPLTIDGEFRLTVEGISVHDRVTFRDGGVLQAEGALIILRVRLANLSKEPAELSAVNVRLVDQDGSLYDTRTGLADRQFSWLDGHVLQKRIQPKGEAVGPMAFDIPKAAQVRYLRVSRGFGIFADDNGFALLSLDRAPASEDQGASTAQAGDLAPKALPPPSDASADKGGGTADNGELISQRGPFPEVERGGTIWDYSDDELRAVVRWIKADKKSRDDDTLLIETMHELGFKRRGSTISTRIGKAIDGER